MGECVCVRALTIIVKEPPESIYYHIVVNNYGGQSQPGRFVSSTGKSQRESTGKSTGFSLFGKLLAGNEGSSPKVSFTYCRRPNFRIRSRSNISQIVRTSGEFAKNAFLRFVVKVEFPSRNRQRFFVVFTFERSFFVFFSFLPLAISPGFI